jgi:DNA-binding NarL/FixJ family response regulator
VPFFLHMAVADTALNEPEVPTDPLAIVVCTDSVDMYRRIEEALGAVDLNPDEWHDSPAAIPVAGVASGAIVIFTCDIDSPREVATLRTLRKALDDSGLVVVSPPANGSGVRRALDAGADALVFEPELEATLGVTVRAVASGQSVVPRRMRASVERPPLSYREREVLALVVRGFTNAQIADRLFLSESTIKSHLSSAFAKLGVHSRKEAAAIFLQLEQRPVGGAER